MKKYFLLLTFIVIGFQATIAQDFDKIKKDIEDSNEDIQHEKRKLKAKTWDARAKVFIDAYLVNIRGLSFGMQARKTSENMFQNIEVFVGEPQKIEEAKGMEIWQYPNISLYIKDNALSYWKEKKVVDEKALFKASKAYKKAIEVDDEHGKGKYKEKSSTMKDIAELRSLLTNKAVNNFYAGEYDKASEAFGEALVLADFPREESDTAFNKGMIAYYAGQTAQSAKKYDEALEYYELSKKENYEVGSVEHGIFEIRIAKGDSIKAIEGATKAYEENPKAEQILYDIINYYLQKGDITKAESYIDLAIKKYPKNASLYIVKANTFFPVAEDYKKEYVKARKDADSLRKAAFRERYNKKENERLLNEQKEKEKEAIKIRENWDKTLLKVEDMLKQVQEMDKTNFEASFLLGISLYNRSEMAREEKGLIPYSEDKDGKKAEAKEIEQKKYLKEAAIEFEKAHKIKPKDRDVLQTLKSIYYKLQENEKYKIVKEKLENL